MGRWSNALECLAAVICFAVAALAVAGGALTGRASFARDTMLDTDPLYAATARTPPYPVVSDPTPIVLDWPRDLAIAKGFRAGRIDEWNPLAACGTPLWAELGGPFFPLKLPFYLAPSRRTYNTFLILRIVFAALGAYLLAQQVGVGLAGGITAGVTYALSGALMYQAKFGVYSNTFVLPWVLFASTVLAARRDRVGVVIAAVAVSIAASAGHPGIALLCTGAYAASVFGHIIRLRREARGASRLLILAVISLVVGLALAAPTLLPVAGLLDITRSYKAEAIGIDARTGGLTGARLILPLGLFDGDQIGVTGAAAAMIGLVHGALDAPLLCVALLGLIIGTVPHGFGWIDAVPGVALILPLYAVPFVVLPFCHAAGVGVEALRTTTRSRAFIALVVSSVSCATLWLVCGARLSLVAAVLRNRNIVLGLLSVPAVTAILLSVVAVRNRPIARWAAAVVAAAIVCGRVAANMGSMAEPGAVASGGPPSPAVRFLQDRLAAGDFRMVGVPHSIGYPVSPMLFGLPDFRGFAAFPLRRYVDYFTAIPSASVETAAQCPKLPFDMAQFMVVQHVRAVRSPLLDLASVRYVVVCRKPGAIPDAQLAGDPDLRLVFASETVSIYDNRAAFPRARIVHRAVSVPDEATARAWIAGVGRMEVHAGSAGLGQMVVVEPDERGKYPELADGENADNEVARITDTTDPDRLTIETDLRLPGLLVVSDSYHPGWQARVDGVSTSTYPVDLLFRGVAVPAGSHVVQFAYDPRASSAGMILFTGGVAVATALLVPRRRKRGRAAEHQERIGQPKGNRIGRPASGRARSSPHPM